MKFFQLSLLSLLVCSANGFSVQSNTLVNNGPSASLQHSVKNNNIMNQRVVDTRLGLFGLDGALSAADTFFQTEPYVAAFLTCSLKASAADWVAQSQQQEHNIRRNLAFIMYGGLYQGCVQTFIYSALFPAWFPDPSVQTILTQVGIDLFILGPMLCMPTVYTMKALFAGEEGTAGIQKYFDHVQTKGILFKYWAIWGPVQTLNFGIVPHHLRVVFVAMVSFFWICLLSTVSSEAETNDTVKEQSAAPTNSRLPALLPIPVLAGQVHQSSRQEQQTTGGFARVTSS